MMPIDTHFLRDYAITRGYTCGRPTGISVTPDGDAVLFLRSGPRDVIRNLYEMNVATGEVRCLARAEDILQGKSEKLSAEERARRERLRESGQGITWYKLSNAGDKVLIGLSGKLYVIMREDGGVTNLPDNDAGPAIDPQFSPDGEYVACVRGYDLHVINIATGQDKALTTGGTQELSHGMAEFVAQEEMDRRSGFWWSDDSKMIAYEEADQRDVETMYIADAVHPSAPPQGWRYPRAGQNNAKVRLGIIAVTGGETKWVDWDSKTYPYLASVRWGEDNPLTIYVQDRGQHEAVLYKVDPATGHTEELLKENDPAWINIDAGMPQWLSKNGDFLWTTERNGEKQLEVRSAKGAVRKSVAPPQARLFSVAAIDRERNDVIVNGATDSKENHLYRLSLRGSEIAALTEGSGVHGGTFARSGKTWVHSMSMANGATKQQVCGRDATLRGDLPSVAEEPPFMPQVEWATVTADGREYATAIVRPRNFQRGQKYPVIDYVYGGPGHTMVSADARSYLRQQWMADQGFIVVSADGRGTPRRGRDWERAIARDIIEIPLADQVAAIQALGAKHSEMDMTRVGIYGWSFGGYFSVMAACRRPDVFHAAVGGAPVIDWEDYDTHYTERYMSTPQDNADGYHRCNATSYAGDLRRPLLLIHGTTDDNVYFTHTLKMADSLFKAGKPYELLVLPGFTHMVPDPDVTTRLYERIVGFFRKTLVENKPEELNLTPAEDKK